MRDPVKVIELKKSILEDNDADAEVLRGTLKDEKLLYINIMSSPGSGKTTTLSAVINRLKDEMKIGVMEADIDSDVDAQTIAALGVKSIQLHTGGMCHLDAEMSRQGMREMGTEDLDVVFLENVGNLVCPAEFDTGSAENVVILSGRRRQAPQIPARLHEVQCRARQQDRRSAGLRLQPRQHP